MKAFVAGSYGGPEVMSLAQIPEPAPSRGQVVVTVKASSVNPVDWKIRNGDFRILTGRKFPKVYGCDLAGVIRAVGTGVTTFAVGDAVYGCAVTFGKPGAHADQVAAPAKSLRRLPSSLTFEQAAALPAAALTALNGLRRCGELKGKTVVINGATGGVGHFATQIAKARGAKVTAVASARNAERAKALGAERVIDYQAQDFTQGAERYDVVFDAYGHLGFTAAARVLEPRGIYVTTLAGPGLFLQGLWRPLLGGKQVASANLRTKQEDYAALERYVADGQVIPVVAQVFSLEQAADAFAAQEAGGTVGKVVIRVN